MNTRRNQNSILVIATLGVYLGLALAGAAPQVLANAALARSFDVRDEIEVSDDLDNKPDDERSPVTASVQIYLEDLEYFLSSLGRLAGRGKFDFKKDSFDVAQNTLLPCVAGNIAGRYTPIRFITSSEDARSALSYFSRGMTYGYSLGDCLPNFEFKDVSAVDSRFDYRLDAKEFIVHVTVKKQTPQNAAALLRELKTTFNLYARHADTNLRKKIIDNTRLRVTDDQVLVVTRLPRSGLDSLLVTSAK